MVYDMAQKILVVDDEEGIVLLLIILNSRDMR